MKKVNDVCYIESNDVITIRESSVWINSEYYASLEQYEKDFGSGKLKFSGLPVEQTINNQLEIKKLADQFRLSAEKVTTFLIDTGLECLKRTKSNFQDEFKKRMK